MKKISPPHPNEFIKKEPPINPADITIEDLQKFWDENKMDFPVTVKDIGNGMVEIKTKNMWGIVPMKKYNEELLKAAKK